MSEAVEATGVEAAGLLVKARDTDHILLLQRAWDPSDPHSGEWELPGGHVEEGGTALATAQREWEEEVGCNLPPDGRLMGEWTSPNGVYRGFLWLVPHQDSIPINLSDPDVDNPDGNRELCRWFDIQSARSMPTLRPELRDTAPWAEIIAVGAGALQMGYHPDRRQAALDAYVRHGSVRRAAKAVNIPKSTVHAWVQREAARGATPADQVIKPAKEQVTDNERIEEQYEDAHADATQDAPPNPGLPSNLNPQNPDLPPTSAVGMGTNTQLEPGAPITADPRTAERSAQSPGMWTRADNPDFLKGFRRWVNLRSNGVSPQYATDAVQQIDEDWEITRQEQDYVDEAIARMKTDGRFWMAERLVFDGAPDWLQDLVDQYRMKDPTLMATAISSVRTQAYLTAINANLAALGLPPVTAITDVEVLADIAKDAGDSADDVLATYNSDLQNVAGRILLQTQIESPSGTTPQAAAAAALGAWAAGRMDWKSDQVATTEAAHAFNQGMRDFHTHNAEALEPIGGYVEPGGCKCEDCCDLVAMGDADNPIPMADLASISLPVHPGCPHSVTYVWGDEWDQSMGAPWAA